VQKNQFCAEGDTPSAFKKALVRKLDEQNRGN
jgi:hypothetical protein